MTNSGNPLDEPVLGLYWIEESDHLVAASVRSVLATLTGEQRDQLVFVIATELDNPSLYMGGPSVRSRRKAQAIVERLGREDR